jgi:cyclopropane-fatty-acyl-phospholipid synthase
MKRNGRGFIERYIFPDSDLPSLGFVVQSAEKNGFEVRDVESLREHYDQTLCCWLSKLERRFADAERIVGRETARMWRLYLAASAVAFRFGKIGVYQVLLAKRTAAGKVAGIPRCRAAWYPPNRSETRDGLMERRHE